MSSGNEGNNRHEQENWKILAEEVVDLLEQQPDFCLEVDKLNDLLGEVGLLGSSSGRLNERDLRNKMAEHVEVTTQFSSLHYRFSIDIHLTIHFSFLGISRVLGLVPLRPLNYRNLPPKVSANE